MTGTTTTDEECLRAHGLESPKGRTTRKARVRKGKLSVLLCQEQLWDKYDEDVMADPAIIAKVYTEYTLQSTCLALNSAAICEAQARAILVEDQLNDKLYDQFAATTTNNNASHHGSKSPSRAKIPPPRSSIRRCSTSRSA